MANKTTRGKQPEHPSDERRQRRANRAEQRTEKPRDEAAKKEQDPDSRQNIGYSMQSKYYSRGHQGGYRGL